ncbi:MAG: ABC transporter permease [Anaerolineae bacterium]
MLQYIVRRTLLMIPTIIAISVVAFIIIQLPPGDYLTSLVATMATQGEQIEQSSLEALKVRYGLGQPVYVQYFKWVWGILHGDFGQSFEWNKPVSDLIWDRLALTFVLSLSTLLFTWIVAFPIGIYSAVRQYSLGDYVFTFLGFIGLATPNFLLALVLMYISFKYFNQSVGGLFSPEFVEAPWSWAKVWDLAKHLWIPMIILGTSGTAGLIRIMRANLLDELHKPYVVTARAKGLPERKLILKYPVRVALNPFVSTVGWTLPSLVSGSAIVSVVLSLPTTGPLLLRALMAQDMYLAGSFILMLSILTVIGTLLSDILLAWLDPRIRFQ